MLFELERVIQAALLDNEQIVEYVSKTTEGFPNIGANRTSQGVFPLIEYHQIYGSDELFGDNELLTRQYNFQVGVYSQHNDFFKVEQEIDSVMRKLGFSCYNDYKFAMDDTKVIHRILLYTIQLNKQMYIELLEKYSIGDEE